MARFEKDIKQTAAELERATPPDDDFCKAFHASLVAFGNLQVAHLAEMRTLVEAMKAANPGSDEEVDRVAAAIDALGEKESVLQNVVGAKQKAMAREHKLRLQ